MYTSNDKSNLACICNWLTQTERARFFIASLNETNILQLYNKNITHFQKNCGFTTWYCVSHYCEHLTTGSIADFEEEHRVNSLTSVPPNTKQTGTPRSEQNKSWRNLLINFKDSIQLHIVSNYRQVQEQSDANGTHEWQLQHLSLQFCKTLQFYRQGCFHLSWLPRL